MPFDLVKIPVHVSVFKTIPERGGNTIIKRYFFSWTTRLTFFYDLIFVSVDFIQITYLYKVLIERIKLIKLEIQ